MERQSISGSAWGAAFVALLINSAYLAATASPTLFYFANVVLHMGLGVVLGIVWVRRVLQARTAADRTERLAAAPGPFALAASSWHSAGSPAWRSWSWARRVAPAGCSRRTSA